MTRSVAKFIGILVFVGVVGLAFGILAGLAAGFILREELFGFGGLVGALAGMMIGYPVGIIIGLIIVRRRLYIRGSLWLGVAGIIAGAVIILALANFIIMSPNQIFGSYFSAVALLGTSGFYLKRKRPERPAFQ